MFTYASEHTHELDGALAKAQGSYRKPIPNEDDNRGKKFANLSAILDAVREALSLNGLSFTQRIELMDEGQGSMILRTRLGHSSGQWTSSLARIIPTKTLRQEGNLIEIIKRRQAQLLLGVAPSQYDPVGFDDDGAEDHDLIAIESIKKPQSESQKALEPLKNTAALTQEQYTDLMTEIGKRDHILASLLSFYNVESAADIPRSEYLKAISKIRKIKDAEDKYLRDS